MELIIIAILFGALVGIGLFWADKKPNYIADSDTSVLPRVVNQDAVKPLDYSIYKFSLGQYLFNIVLAGAGLYAIGLIFYQNQIVALLFAAAGVFYPKLRKKELLERRREELSFQFRQALYSLSSALIAGRSVENAFKEITDDLKLLYPNPKTLIIQELQLISRRVENGVPIEKAIKDFSSRANVEDITSFADVFITCKRTGGDLVEVIRITSNILGEKLETQQEIAVLIAQKKFEAKILSIAPFILVALISRSSPDYMAPLYQLGIGTIVMTISLLILGFSYWVSTKLMKIKV